jgi:hypothetical protein
MSTSTDNTQLIFKDNSVNVPEKVVMLSLHPREKRIPDKFCAGWSSFTTIYIPNAIEIIGSSAFFECTSLASIHIPNNVTTILNGAFEGCSSLRSIHIPDSVTTIGDMAFEKCSSLVSINLPENVTMIGYRAFENCSSLTSIHIPEKVSAIHFRTFCVCSSLKSVYLPEKVTTIESCAFGACSSLTSINIPENVSVMGTYAAFYGCSSLTSINIPENVTRIGNGTFDGCSSLLSIYIHGSISNIGHVAFRACTSLASIAIPPSVTDMEYNAFSDCDTLEKAQGNTRNIPNWLCHRFDNLPFHQICYNDASLLNITTFNHLIQEHSSMLTTTDDMLMTPLHILCCNPTATNEMIQLLKAAQPHAASMMNVMNKTPLMMLLELKNKKYNALHDDGKMSLVDLLEQGLDYDSLEMIRTFDGDEKVELVSELENRDEVSGLLPFMYGASFSKCRLDIVYELAMERVDLLQVLDF